MPFVSGVSYREPAASITMQVTDWACGSGAVMRRIGSVAKNTVPSATAWTSPLKRKSPR